MSPEHFQTLSKTFNLFLFCWRLYQQHHLPLILKLSCLVSSCLLQEKNDICKNELCLKFFCNCYLYLNMKRQDNVSTATGTSVFVIKLLKLLPFEHLHYLPAVNICLHPCNFPSQKCTILTTLLNKLNLWKPKDMQKLQQQIE